MIRAWICLGVMLAGVRAGSCDECVVVQDEIRAAVGRSLPLLEKTAREFTRQRDCFSCHHQTLPLLALTLAEKKGFAVSREELQEQIAWTAKFLKRNEERYREGKGTGGQADTAGYGLWALESGGYSPDSMTEAVTEYLLLRHKDRDHWQRTSRRPPTEASDFTTTFLAIQGLVRFASPAQKERADGRIAQARQWLIDSAPQDTEDHVFRLRGLQVATADELHVAGAARQLLERQRDDGGWAQLDGMDSDAYATGSALAALSQAGGIPVGDARYQRGLRFLLGCQLDDGSWHVATRSKPVQQYFESGFPHGADQFISVSATGWSAVALALALPDTAPRPVEPQVPVP
jgi:hypothetical protein